MKKFLTFFILPITLLTSVLGISLATPQEAFAWNYVQPNIVAASSLMDFMGHNEKGCIVRYVDYTPVFTQGGNSSLNLHDNTHTSGANNSWSCDYYGEYNSLYYSNAYGNNDCSASSETAVVDTYMNKLYEKPADSTKTKYYMDPNKQFIINDATSAMSPYFTGSGYSASPDYTSTYHQYAFVGFSYGANRMMKQKGLTTQFKGYGFNANPWHTHTLARNIYRSLPWSQRVAYAKIVLNFANTNHVPLIMGMFTRGGSHFTTIWGWDSSSQMVSGMDSRDLIGLPYAAGGYGGGEFLQHNGVQVFPLTTFVNYWMGEAYLLEPTTQNLVLQPY